MRETLLPRARHRSRLAPARPRTHAPPVAPNGPLPSGADAGMAGSRRVPHAPRAAQRELIGGVDMISGIATLSSVRTFQLRAVSVLSRQSTRPQSLSRVVIAPFFRIGDDAVSSDRALSFFGPAWGTP